MNFKLFLVFTCLLTLSTVVRTNSLLLILNYQQDLMIGGRYGVLPTSDPVGEKSKYDQELKALQEKEAQTTQNIISLVQKSTKSPIIYSGLIHPENHISFLSRHLAENASKQEVLEYLETNNEVQVVYDVAGKPTYRETVYSMDEVPDQENQFVSTILLKPDYCVKYSSQTKSKKTLSEIELNGIQIQVSVKQALKAQYKTNKKIKSINVGTLADFDDLTPVVKELDINPEFKALFDKYNPTVVYLVGADYAGAGRQTISMLNREYPGVEVVVVADALQDDGFLQDQLASSQQRVHSTLANTAEVLDRLEADQVSAVKNSAKLSPDQLELQKKQTIKVYLLV